MKNFIKATSVNTVAPHGSDEVIIIMSKNADQFGLILPREAACILSNTLPGAIAESYRNKPHQAPIPHLNLLAKSATVGPGQSSSDHVVLYLGARPDTLGASQNLHKCAPQDAIVASNSFKRL